MAGTSEAPSLRSCRSCTEWRTRGAGARRWPRTSHDYIAKRIPWSEVDKGALLHGEPGTGKTIFATALAATCKVPLVATSYAEWQRSKDGHLGDVLAAMNATSSSPRSMPRASSSSTRSRPSARARPAATISAGTRASSPRSTSSCDGIFSREGVVVIAATNYPDRIDPALLRPGRLDTRIAIPMPSAEDLRGIVRFHLREDLPDADLGGLAVALAGSTGADVERIVRVARRRARKLERELLLEDLFAALGEKLTDIAARVPGAHRHPRGRARGGGRAC